MAAGRHRAGPGRGHDALPRHRAVGVVRKLLPPAEYLMECFSYDPDTGILTWKNRPREHFADERAYLLGNAQFAGKSAGCITQFNYLIVGINRKIYMAHRIIWKLQTGRDPVAEIDHINRERLDNRWKNIREATHGENITNRSGRNGLPNGVHRQRGKYTARPRFPNGARTYLGTFNTPGEARAAYLAFVRVHRKEFFNVDEG